MKLSEICIKRPVFATVLNLIILVVGWVGFSQSEIRFFPNVDIPRMTVQTYFAGAAPSTMESAVTTILENAIADVDGIASVTSSSGNSWSTIYITFSPTVNLEEAVGAVRDKISAVRKDLPDDADLPIISVGGNSGAVLEIGMTDDKRSIQEIRDYIDRNVYPLLRQVPGVGAVYLHGASTYALRLWLNAEKMATLGVTVANVQAALRANNIQFPSGVIKNPNRNFSIISNTQLKNANEFADIVILKNNNRLIRFKDIASVEIGTANLDDLPLRINGKQGMNVEIAPLSTANPIEVADKVKVALAGIQAHLPAGMHAEINYDQSIFLKSSIHETFKAIIEAIILVVMVTFLFLGSLRAAIIPIVTLPICILGVFGIIFFAGFTINTMTLLAIVLAIGLVVDDAIVMLENIYRHLEENPTLPAMQAAMIGSQEILVALIGMTITLAAVYAPLGFFHGPTASIFREFGFTLAGAVLISGFVALTLSPMMSARLLTVQNSAHPLTEKIDALFLELSQWYEFHLTQLLAKPKPVLQWIGIVSVVGLFSAWLLHSEFIPQEDIGFIQTSIYAPSGSSATYTNRYLMELESALAKFPDIQSYYTMQWGGSARADITLKPWGDRNISSLDLVKKLRPVMAAIPGIDIYPSIPDLLDFDSGDLTVNVMTAGAYDDLTTPVNTIVNQLKHYKGLQRISSTLTFDNQQYALTINRNLAADLGVNIQDIADSLTVMMSGKHVTNFDNDGRSYPVLLQMQKEDLEDFNGINKLYVNSASGKMIPLSSLVTLTPIIGQQNLPHYNRLRSATISASLAPGYTISQAVAFLQKTTEHAMTSQTHYALDGKAKDYVDSKGSLLHIFLLSFVFLYLILAAQFESFIDPFVILLTVPFSMAGALFLLWITGGTLNLYSQIGLITLTGLIAKHGILMTQFANELRRQGMKATTAIVTASQLRLRPILMTTSAMIAGSIPLAIASGPGSIGRAQIGIVIIGGLLIGTFFSLVVVPLAYIYAHRDDNKL